VKWCSRLLSTNCHLGSSRHITPRRPRPPAASAAMARRLEASAIYGAVPAHRCQSLSPKVPCLTHNPITLCYPLLHRLSAKRYLRRPHAHQTSSSSGGPLRRLADGATGAGHLCRRGSAHGPTKGLAPSHVGPATQQRGLCLALRLPEDIPLAIRQPRFDSFIGFDVIAGCSRNSRPPW